MNQKELNSQTIGSEENGVIMGVPGSLIEEMSIVVDNEDVLPSDRMVRSPEIIAAEINMIKTQTAM